MMRALLQRYGLMVLLSVMGGCSRNIAPSVTSEVSDSTHVVYTPRPYPVYLPGDTVEINRGVECDSLTNKPKPFKEIKKSRRVGVSVDLNSNGVLRVIGACDSLKLIIQAQDREIYRLRTQKRLEVQPVIKYKVHSWDIACRWVTGIVLMIIIGFLASKYLKTWLPWKTKN